MGATNTTGGAGRYFQIKTVDWTPYFQEYKGKDESWNYLHENFSTLDGHFESLEYRTKNVTIKWKDKELEEIVITLDDNWEKFVIQTLWNSIARSLLNTLWSAWDKGIGHLVIKLYRSKAWYASIYIEHDWERMEWAIDWEWQKALIKSVEINWDTQNDYTSLHEALKSASKSYVPKTLEAKSQEVVEELWLEEEVF